jgi:hypothetical protein
MTLAVMPSCPAHADEEMALRAALAPLCTEAWPTPRHRMAVQRAIAAKDARDARELRGEPPSMEGWTIFDGSAP